MIIHRKFSFWLFIPILILQAYTSFNKKATGYRHFSSMQNINLINYNLYYFKAFSESKDEARIWKDSIYNSAYEEMDFAQKNKYLNNVAKRELKENFLPYSVYHVFTAVRGSVDPGRFDLMTFFRKEDGSVGFLEILNTDKSVFDLLKDKLVFVYLLLIPIFLLNIIKWFLTARYLLFKKLSYELYYIILVMLSYIFITGPVNSSRYLVPFQLALITFAILGLKTKRVRK